MRTVLSILAFFAITSTNVLAARAELANLESITNTSSQCAYFVDLEPSNGAAYANSVIVFALDHKTGKGQCFKSSSSGSLDALTTGALKRCAQKTEGRDLRCHILSQNTDWIAQAKDFSDLPKAVVTANRLSHKRYAAVAKTKAKTKAIRKSLRDLSYNQLGDSIVAGDLTPADVFAQGGPFKFNKPLKTTAIPNYDVVALTKAGQAGFPAKTNPWLSNQRKVAISALRKAGSGIVVAPVQTIGYGFDRRHRAALSLALANQIEELTGRRTADPLLVARTFADGLRAVAIGDLRALADEIGARVLVVPYLGHDNGSRLFVRVKALSVDQATGSAEELVIPDFEHEYTFNDAQGALIVGGQAFSEFATALNIAIAGSDLTETSESARSNVDPDFQPTLISPSRVAAERQAAGPSIVAFEYQWIAALVPARMTSLRSELYARSLAHIQAENADASPFVAVTQARALAELGSLPAARLLLSRHTDASAQAYLAFTKGQVKEMQRHLGKVANKPQRDLLRIDLSRLLQAAGAKQSIRKKNLSDLVEARPLWAPLIRHQLLADGFGTFESSKSLLPFLGKSAEESWTDLLLGKKSGVDFDLLAFEGLQEMRDKGVGRCAASTQYCPATAFIDMIESLVVQAAILPIEHLIYGQARYGQGVAYLNEIDPVLQGNVIFEKMVASTHGEIKRRAPNTEAVDALDDRLKRAHNFLRHSIEFTENLVFHPNHQPVTKATYYGYRQANAQNYPPPHAWSRNLTRGRKEDRQQRLQRELDHLFFYLPEPFSDAMFTDPQIKSQAIARFGEHKRLVSRLSANLAKARKTPDNVAELIDFSERRIQMEPSEWIGYSNLGFALARDRNDYSGAVKVFSSYPGFSNLSDQSALRVDSYAAEVADFYFWRGETANARQFYEAVARLKTGSARYLAAEQRLSQLAGDYERTLAFANARIERYGSEFAARDLIAWYFVMGQDELAWQAFTGTHNIFEMGQPWLAAQVGARRAGKSWDENVSWLGDPAHNLPNKRSTPFSAIAATGLALMDRNPTEQAAKDIEKLETQMGMKAQEWVIVPSAFVHGMTSLRAGEYSTAYNRLAAELERIKGSYANGYEYGDVILPYVAYAAAHSPEHAQTAWQQTDYRKFPVVEGGLLSGFSATLNGKGNYDFELAKAFQTGLAGNHELAVAHLETAFNYMPYAERRVIHPEYQWAEACELLYQDTGQKVYRQMALDWAKKYQEVIPYAAWPYAIEARLSEDNDRQLRAIAFVQYLDPKSVRLSQISMELRQAAKETKLQVPWL